MNKYVSGANVSNDFKKFVKRWIRYGDKNQAHHRMIWAVDEFLSFHKNADGSITQELFMQKIDILYRLENGLDIQVEKMPNLNIQLSFYNDSWSKAIKSLNIVRLDDKWLTANITINDTTIEYCDFYIDEYHNIQFKTLEYWKIGGAVFDTTALLDHVQCEQFFEEFGQVAVVETASMGIDESFYNDNELTVYGQWFLNNEFDKILEKIDGIDDWYEDEAVMDFFEIKEDEITEEHAVYETLHNKSHWITNAVDGVDWLKKHTKMAIKLTEYCEKQGEVWLKESQQMDVFKKISK